MWLGGSLGVSLGVWFSGGVGGEGSASTAVDVWLCVWLVVCGDGWVCVIACCLMGVWLGLWLVVRLGV